MNHYTWVAALAVSTALNLGCNVEDDSTADAAPSEMSNADYGRESPEQLDGQVTEDLEVGGDLSVPGEIDAALPADSEITAPVDSAIEGHPDMDTADDAGAAQLPDIEVMGRQLLVNGAPIHLKGVSWNPVPRGGMHPGSLDYSGFVDQDSQMMAAAGVNVVRNFEPITDPAVLDRLWSRGIFVINTVYSWGGLNTQSAVDVVEQLKGHPAILMWSIGNEWNYNGLYANLALDDAIIRIGEVARAIKEADPSRPVSTTFGEMVPEEVLSRLPEIDVWGFNVYRGIGFGDFFETFAARSSKPMFFSEYGADAYNANINGEDQAAQAEATRVLTELIVANSASLGGTCIGGLIFEWADEWWKAPGRPDVHDVGGAAPGGGPHPDGVFNEEWWGLVDIDRNPRLAYRVFAEIETP